MSVYKQKGSKNRWYELAWRGRQIRKSAKQSNKRVPERMKAAHKAALAKAEAGLREKKPVPTVREFIENDFAPFAESRFANKAKTLEYYRIGLKNRREFDPLANSPLNAITGDKIAAFIVKRRQGGTVRALHVPPHPPDPLGCVHGPVHPRPPRRYVHPQAETIKAAIDRARSGHRIGHSESETAGGTKPSAVTRFNDSKGMIWSGREDSNLRPPGPEPGALPS